MPLPRAVARFNRSVANRVTSVAAERLPGFAIVVHRGRRSGQTYETPVNVLRRPGAFVFALTYGRGDWVQNVLAAGEARVRTRGRTHRVQRPRVVRDTTRAVAPAAVRRVLGLLDVDEFLWVDVVGASAGPRSV